MSNRRKLRRTHPGAPAAGQVFAVPVALRESQTATAERVVLAEATMGGMAPAGGRRYRARLIEGDRWGSSGFWPAKVIERDGPTAWPVGTQLFLDHPTATESADRPERSVRDLAARIVSTPVYESDGLYADVEVFPHAAPMVEALADAIGLSVRGDGTGSVGKVGDRSGIIIESIDRGYSVDFVTKAGAGGKLVSLLEAAREVEIREARNVGAWIEAQLHSALTDIADQMYGNGQLTREERITLSNAVGDALQAWTARVEKDAPQLFQRDLYDGPPDDGAAVAESAVSLREVSDTPWSQFSASDYTPGQYRSACLIDTGTGSPDSKDRYKLPVKQPDGTLNRNGVHAATQRLGSTQASADAKKAAARKLVGLYRSQLKEDPPASLLSAAGMGESAAAPVANLSEGAEPTPGSQPIPEPLPIDVTGGAPPAGSNPPEEESSVSGTNTGPAPGTAGSTEATAVPAAVTEAEAARMRAEQERDTALREAREMRQSLARLTAVEAARPIASTILAESSLPPAARERVLAAAVRDVPLHEADELHDGAVRKTLRLDEATFRTSVTEATKVEETYVASLREAAGDGRITGLGAGATGGADATKQFETGLAESFKRLGMSSDAALVAAGGRA